MVHITREGLQTCGRRNVLHCCLNMANGQQQQHLPPQRHGLTDGGSHGGERRSDGPRARIGEPHPLPTKQVVDSVFPKVYYKHIVLMCVSVDIISNIKIRGKVLFH